MHMWQVYASTATISVANRSRTRINTSALLVRGHRKWYVSLLSASQPRLCYTFKGLVVVKITSYGCELGHRSRVQGK